jgi:hypothetical protein
MCYRPILQMLFVVVLGARIRRVVGHVGCRVCVWPGSINVGCDWLLCLCREEPNMEKRSFAALDNFGLVVI